MKSAIVCTSPIHILRTLEIIYYEEYFQGDIEVIVSSLCPNYEFIVRNMSHIYKISAVYAVNMEQLQNKGLVKLMFGKCSFSEILKRNKYTKLISFNVENILVQALYAKNKGQINFEYHYMEDGPFIYQPYVPRHYAKLHPYRILGWDKPVFHMKACWSSCPEYMIWPEEYGNNVKALKPIDINDKNYLSDINYIFDYEDSSELEDVDIIFMEESHFTDGLMKENYDYKIFEIIKEKYKDFKVVVKLHPRTIDNRFASKFTVIKKSKYPWELILLNRLNRNAKPLIQISIACGTMMSDKFMFNINGPKVILSPLFYDKVIPNNGVRRVSEKLTNQFKMVKEAYANPKDFLIAESMDEVFEMLDRYLGK